MTERPFRRLLPYLPRYRNRILLGMGFVLASRALMVYAPMLLRRALSVLEGGADGGPDALAQASTAAWAFLAVSALAGLFTWAQRLFLIGASRSFERELKQDLFAHLERLPVSYYDRTRSGDLLARLTSDVEAVRWIAGPGPMYVAGTVVLFPLALTAMLGLSVPVTLVSLVPLFAIVGVVRFLAPGIMKRSRAVQDRIGDLSARAQESFAGARVVRAYATEDVEVDAFEAQNRNLVDETLGLARYRALMSGSIYALGGLAELVVLVYGGSLVMQGRLGFGDLGAYMAYVGMLIWPMISVGWVVSAIQRAAAAIERIDEVFRVEPEASVTQEPPVDPGGFRGDVRIAGLDFTYPGSDRPALEDVALEVRAGRTLALVGPVGGGKSTVLQLLTRTYEPPPDTVFLDGHDVTQVPLDTLRSAFAIVPQDPFLFSATLFENLAFAVDGPLDPERASSVTATAGLETDLQAFPRGLETVIGERGVTLSGGQKQRATLARALLPRAPILLLDDALSSVDTHTEARILDRLRTEMGNRTVLIVAHRLSTVRDADHIVVLQDGRVTESGAHQDLVDSGGWYARTYANQRLEAELEDIA